MYMVDLSASLFGVSAGLTILYYVVKSFLLNKPKVLNIVTYIYYILLLGGVVSLVYTGTGSMCGEVQWVYGLVYGIVPWLFIFGVFSVLLTMCPGWKGPFSNTFGYLYAKIRGVSTYLNDMLNTSYRSKDIEKIYNDPSLLINTLTPLNFDSAIKNLKFNKIINPSRVNFSSNLESLRSLVYTKDNIAECIWKVLVAGLISSISASQIAAIECEHSVKQLESNHAKHTQAMAKQATEEKDNKPKQYYIRE